MYGSPRCTIPYSSRTRDRVRSSFYSPSPGTNGKFKFKSMERDKASTLRSCVQYDRYDVSLLFSITINFYSVNSHNNFYVVHSRAGHGDYNLPIIRHRAHSHRYHSVPQPLAIGRSVPLIYSINNRNRLIELQYTTINTSTTLSLLLPIFFVMLSRTKTIHKLIVTIHNSSPVPCPSIILYIYIPRSVAAKFLRSPTKVASVRISSPNLISRVA